MKHTQKYSNIEFYFDKEGMPKASAETYEVDNFTEFFIHMLSDHLPTIDMEPNSDGLNRLKQFRELYVDCMLASLKEYQGETYSRP